MWLAGILVQVARQQPDGRLVQHVRRPTAVEYPFIVVEGP